MQSSQPNHLPPAPKNSYRPIHTVKSFVATCDFELFRMWFSTPAARNKRTELFRTLGDLNRSLSTLVGDQDEVAKLEIDRTTQRKVSKSLLGPKAGGFCDAAEHLYQSLAQAWQCPCFQHHCAKLMLQHREELDIDFILIFQFHQARLVQAPFISQWKIQEARVTRQENGVNCVVIQVPHTASAKPAHKAAVP